MGCSGSKLDDLPAVALCRKRTELLSEAIRHRYALADAHRQYALSLRSVGSSLHRLLLLLDTAADQPPPPSPVLILPPPAAPAIAGSDSHLDFDSSGDESDSDSDLPLHSADASPIHLRRPPETTKNTVLNYSLSRPAAAASLSFEQSTEAIHSSDFGRNPSDYLYQCSYDNHYASGIFDGGMGGGFWDSGSSPPAAAAPAMDSGTPPPPSCGSAWDFLNVFQSYENHHYHAYPPSQSSKDIREEEGIPELEEDEELVVVVKEVKDGDRKLAASAPAAAAVKEVDEAAASCGVEGVVPEEKNMVSDGDKATVVAAAEEEELRNGVAGDAASEIKEQFERASQTIGELSAILEVGKLPYHEKSSVYQVSSRIICVMAPRSGIGGDLLVFEKDGLEGSEGLSSTLQKLFIWEKKLYDQVKAEEKMRILHDRKCKRLKELIETGSESRKIDSAGAEIRELSAKILIAIRIVESISKEINNLRDSELWPQTNDLIQGFVRIWRVMLQCHQAQCRAVSEAENLDRELGEAHMELMLELELELLGWIGSFSSWVARQRKFFRAMKGWLELCLQHEPEQSSVGIGGPPAFVACIHWSQALDRTSERDAIVAMAASAASIRRVWDRQMAEKRSRLTTGEDGVGDGLLPLIRAREREAVSMTRAVEGGGRDSERFGLRKVFQAMESFTMSSMRAYDELQVHILEERL